MVPGTPSLGPRVMLGRVLAAQGRADEALAEFDEAEARSPGDPRPPLGAGRALLSLGRREEAAEAFERAAAGRGTKADIARLERAALALEDGDCDGAERWLNALPKGATSAWRSELRLALAEDRVGRRDAARARIEAAIENEGSQPMLWATLASLQDRAGDREGSIRSREKTLSLAPAEIWPKNDLAYALAKAGRDLDRARELALEAAESGDPNTLDTLATVELARGEASKALATAQRGLALAKVGDARPHLELLQARALAALGRAEEARAGLRRSVEGLAKRPSWANEAEQLAERLGIELSLPAPSDPACPA